MKLIYNENSDLIDESPALNKSLFSEIFNQRLWQWYKELGLIAKIPEKQYLYFVKGRMMFDSDVEEGLKLGFIRSMKLSLILPGKLSGEINGFDPSKIENICKTEEDFQRLWTALIDNFRYSILAGLILQYRLDIVPDKYKTDIAAMRYNALHDLGHGMINKDEFDSRYGFLAESDYDFSCPRYYETKKIESFPRQRLPERGSINNFREHVKFSNIKLIARIRLVMLKKDRRFFDKTKEQLMKLPEQKLAKAGNVKTADFKGKTFSGKGIIEGVPFIVRGKKDYSKVPQDAIIVTSKLDPDLVILYPLIKGVISERGGALSHAAIVAREKSLPLLGQVTGAMKLLQGKKKVKVDLDNQLIIAS